MQIPYQPWIDWLKVLGMAVIIFGHSGGHALIPPIFNPINLKQLGVCFFVFATAFTLANETRRPLQVLYNRYFEVFVLGVLLAMFVSVVKWFRVGDLNESNYLPFVLGLNVFWENAFPANPTTWYVGTYMHLLVAWAVALRFLPTRWYVLVGLLLVEVIVRSVFVYQSNDFNAYMVFTSWLSVFFIGMYFGRLAGDTRNANSPDSTPGPAAADDAKLLPSISPTGRRIAISLTLAAMMFGWLAMVRGWGITKSNPFGRISVGDDVTTSLVTSLAVTVEYLVYTLLIYGFFVGIPANRFVRFLSQNTLFVFLAHMPFRDVVTPYYYPLWSGGWTRQVANFFILFVLLACISHVIRHILGLTKLRKQIGNRLFGQRHL
ncbi:Acyltransferase family protein [Stieleria neptunia]|uniref:Acyltransferase family protein n=1 Tax=Stieleria neptunia TaxID=2527979 RepID=A0A518HQX2_9BACT|nr:acyltransferase [Stieleria neptunia]QDV43252.1 Acyltransferase family protein [Stieleria neptunia]